MSNSQDSNNYMNNMINKPHNNINKNKSIAENEKNEEYDYDTNIKLLKERCEKNIIKLKEEYNKKTMIELKRLLK